MPEKKTLNEDLFYEGSSANLPRLHTCENNVPFWDFKEFAVTVTIIPVVIGAFGTVTKGLLKGLEDLEASGRVETIQTTALLKKATILRRLLET